jgi:hypothetical protein
MKRKHALWVFLASLVLVMVGVATFALIGRLSDTTVSALVGGLAVLAIVALVGALFIVKDLAQAYIMRRLLAQDDLADLKQIAMLARLMGGSNRPSNVNVRLPEGQQAWQILPPQIDGQYRDTITEDLEIQ